MSDIYTDAVNARAGADRMSLGLGCIPDKVRGDMDKVIEQDAEIERLRAALEISRGQWIHSVNASQCLAALGESKEVQSE